MDQTSPERWTDEGEFSRWSTSSLICAPFLDTAFDRSDHAGMSRELRRRGYPRSAVWALRVFAGLGLWWNLLAWEWACLDLNDVVFGYAINFALAALALGIMAAYGLMRDGSPGQFAWLAPCSGVIAIVLFQLARRGWGKNRNLTRETERDMTAVPVSSRPFGVPRAERTLNQTLEVRPDSAYTTKGTGLPLLQEAATAEASFSEILNEEGRKQGLVSTALCYALAAALAIWLLYDWGWPEPAFKWPVLLAMALGGPSLLWLMGICRAFIRLRRRRRTLQA